MNVLVFCKAQTHEGKCSNARRSSVRICEDLLGKARSGEIQGIAAVTQNHDQTVTRHTAGIFTTTRVLGSLMVLIHKITHTKADDDGEVL